MDRRLPARWREPFLMRTGLTQLWDDFFRDFEDLGFDIAPSLGRTDIYEKDRNLIFETELPGMKKEDIQIKVEEGRLVISGETKRSEETKEENYFRIGRRYGRFQRSFPLPADTADTSDASKVKASFKDGILKVTVLLKEPIKEKKKPIEIKVE